VTPEEAGAILHGQSCGLGCVWWYSRLLTTRPGLLITESATIVRQLISIRDAIDSTETTSSLVTKFVKLEFADAATVAQIVQATLDAQAQDQQTKGISTIRGQAGPESGRRSGDDRDDDGGEDDRVQPPPPSPSSIPITTTATGRARWISPCSQPRRWSRTRRLNQVLIVATPEDFTYVASLIQEFDKPVEVAEPFERELNYAYAVDVLYPRWWTY